MENPSLHHQSGHNIAHQNLFKIHFNLLQSRSSHEDYASSYFKPKRADRLLAENIKFEWYDKRELSPSGGTRPKLGFPGTGGSSGALNNNVSTGSGGSIAMGRPVKISGPGITAQDRGEREKKKKKHKNLDERKRDDWASNNASQWLGGLKIIARVVGDDHLY